MLVLRRYQEQAIQKSVFHFQVSCKVHGICVLPTGSGKSVVISEIIKEVGGKFIILQPTSTILEQNYTKYTDLGFDAGIYCSAIKRKELKPVIFATIGTVINNWEVFKTYKNVMIDECHLVNAYGGMYDFFLNTIPDICCVGFTATPYRLKTSSRYSILEFLTRTMPSFFKQVIHVTQQRELIESGYLSPLILQSKKVIDLNRVLVKGGEYEETTLGKEMSRVSIEDYIIHEIDENSNRKSILIFVESVEVLNRLIKKRPDIDFATGTTDDTIKRNKFKAFKNVQTRIFANVGVATTGLDCPSIDFIIIARATRSLSLYYQIIGRGQRIANGKKNCLITDLCGGLELFGDVQKLQVFQGVSGWIVSNGVIATNKSF